MKRIGNLIELIADPDNLRLAYWKAAKGKRYSGAVQVYARDLEENLADLRRQILAAEVQVGQYHFFKIYDPKERQICAASFGEQVLHHALMNICHPFFEGKQIFDSYACRKGKGTYAALDRAQVYHRQYAWCLKLDVRKYFDSISHNALERQMARLFKDWRLLRIFSAIIRSYEASPGCGVPIGNLCSQYFANHYLSGLDHFVKRTLKIKAYVRYMDDMLLWSDEKSVLFSAESAISLYCQQVLDVGLKPMVLGRVENGLPFLGYRLFPYHVRLNQRSKRRFLKKMTLVHDNYQTLTWSASRCQRQCLPLIAFTKYANALNLRQQLQIRLNTR
jgi:RNA-directed DNA polymerase